MANAIEFCGILFQFAFMFTIISEEYDKEASGFDEEKKDQFCIRTIQWQMASTNVLLVSFL